jgi:uncharacterized protein
VQVALSAGKDPVGKEWPATINVDALLAGGWRPVPFREFVLKVHSRCDLSCDYCYMYQMADQSWQFQPKRMSLTIARQVAARIAEHAQAHNLDEISIVLHGGEPLLAGPDLIGHTIDAVRDAAGVDTDVHAFVQTNGASLNEEFLALFGRLGVRVGVSLDGGHTAQDRHRRYANGRGSYPAVAAGLRLLTGARFRHLFSGLLCVIDVTNDPLDVYQGLLEFGPPRVDFLLPHGTWDSPPPRRVGGAATPYADWLTTIFDCWYDNPETRIRLFDQIIHLLLGRPSSTESVGLAPARFVVIETDGAMAQVDSLKATFHGAADTGLNVARDSFDDALQLPQIAARQLGYDALCAKCQACQVWRVCGGGLYAHRYQAGTGFANPSVYCPDLLQLITHIRNRVSADIAERRMRRGDG